MWETLAQFFSIGGHRGGSQRSLEKKKISACRTRQKWRDGEARTLLEKLFETGEEGGTKEEQLHFAQTNFEGTPKLLAKNSTTGKLASVLTRGHSHLDGGGKSATRELGSGIGKQGIGRAIRLDKSELVANF